MWKKLWRELCLVSYNRIPLDIPRAHPSWRSHSLSAKRIIKRQLSYSLIRTEKDQASDDINPEDYRLNEAGVQQLSPQLHKQLFGKVKYTPPLAELVELSYEHRKAHDLHDKATGRSKPIAFKMPELLGDTLDEHFYKIATANTQDAKAKALEFSEIDLPPFPVEWVKRSGWTKYQQGKDPEPVEYPDGEAMVFDTEVMFNVSPFAVIGVVVTADAWFGWVSPWLLGETDNVRHLIPFGPREQPERIVVGHNVGYDRARIKEEYHMKGANIFCIDTMSLHVTTTGMCSQQRPTWLKHKKSIDNYRIEQENKVNLFDEWKKSGSKAILDCENEINDILKQKSAEKPSKNKTATEDSGASRRIDDDYSADENGEVNFSAEPWLKKTSTNSLKEVAYFHCDIEVDKSAREIFSSLDKEEILENFNGTMTYCAKDVLVTHMVYKKLFHDFLETCPHPVTFNALRQLSKTFLPIDHSWKAYIHNSEELYKTLSQKVISNLEELAEIAVSMKDLSEADLRAYLDNDPWLSQLDWTIKPPRYTKPKKKGEEPRPYKNQKLPGYPEWYKSLVSKPGEPLKLTARSRVTPILLRLSWNGYPLVWNDENGFTFRAPIKDMRKLIDQKYILVNEEEIREAVKEISPQDADDYNHIYGLFKVPHPNGPTARCASPLAKGYLRHHESGVLTSEYRIALEALQMNAACSYWISSRERIRSQMTIFEDEDNLDMGFKRPNVVDGEHSNRPVGMILPQVIPMGTITRRAVESTWLTASNAKVNRVGSELKAMVRAPPEYHFVGADVDSEELWIASLMGDAQFGLHGGTVVGWQTLEGSKAEGTDLHSKTASILKISRNHAKIFNYGRIYGAGQKFARQLLLQFNPSTSEAEADEVVKELYKTTKGVKTKSSLYKDRDVAYWRGGSESVVFNKLEDIADQIRPRTPVLSAAITQALIRENVNRHGFITSRVNWAIQSSGVDYLHLLITSMDYLTQKYNIDCRLVLTVHDEVRYLASNQDKYRAAMAMQIANLWTRALFSQKMGINDVPQSAAFFSGVDIDTVLRKEVDMDCVTPSQPNPIPAGESLTMEQLLAKEGCKLDDSVAPKFVLPDYSCIKYDPKYPQTSKTWRDIGVTAESASDKMQLQQEYIDTLHVQIIMNMKDLRALERTRRKDKRSDDNMQINDLEISIDDKDANVQRRKKATATRSNNKINHKTPQTNTKSSSKETLVETSTGIDDEFGNDGMQSMSDYDEIFTVLGSTPGTATSQRQHQQTTSKFS